LLSADTFRKFTNLLDWPPQQNHKRNQSAMGTEKPGNLERPKSSQKNTT